MAGQATAALMCRLHGKRSAQARIWKPGRRRQRYGRLVNASPVRDERIANLEQRDPHSGDALAIFIYIDELDAAGWIVSIRKQLIRAGRHFRGSNVSRRDLPIVAQ